MVEINRMRKGLKLIKKVIALFLVFIFCIESFAVAVSDNDGSAFITKAEFDSLKNNFQSQINQYNTSIDSKIDSAIANYLSGITVARKFNPDVLLNGLNVERRTFTNSWTNPTTSTQDDLFLQITKNVMAVYTLGFGKARTYTTDTLGFYSLNTLSGNHAKTRTPKNNGKTGKYLSCEIYKDEKDGDEYYYFDDVGKYDVKEYIEITGGATSDSEFGDWNYFVPKMDDSFDFSDKTTDSIWKDNFVIAEVYKVPKASNGAPDVKSDWPAAGLAGLIPPDSVITDRSTLTIPGMGAICVLESNTGNVDFLNSMCSGSIWTTQTGTIRSTGFHNWTYKYNDIALAGAGAQAFGYVFYYDPNATNPETGGLGYRQGYGLNVANNYRTVTEPITFMGPKVEMIRGSEFIVKDVTDLVGEPRHYYSGLPLFIMPIDGKVTLKLNLTFNNRNDTIIAVRNQPFDNTSIISRSTKDIYWKKWSSADLATGNITIEIPASDLPDSKGKTLYIKLYNTDPTTDSNVTIYVGDCSVEEEL